MSFPSQPPILSTLPTRRLVRWKIHAAPALGGLLKDGRDAGIDVTRLAVLVQRVVPCWKRW